MLTDLHAALHEHMGKAITPEVAARLYAASQFQPDLSIATHIFDRVSHQGYDFSAERLDEVLDEIHPLHEAQWQETEKYRHALPLRIRTTSAESACSYKARSCSSWFAMTARQWGT